MKMNNVVRAKRFEGYGEERGVSFGGVDGGDGGCMRVIIGGGWVTVFIWILSTVGFGGWFRKRSVCRTRGFW